MKAKPQRQEIRFERAQPNQLWQSDLFTFLLRRHERIYVAAFLDDHSRYLVSLSMAHHQRSTLVLEALSRGMADYGAPREILTDQGRQYTAWRGSTEFEAELRRHGIAHIKSRPHHPQTCGKIERFWKTLWEELLSRTVFADFEDCQRRVSLYVQHYNFQRPHQALEGMTPADRFFRAASAVRAAIEATVAANALRMAREQPPRKPFYLVGRLGDRDLTISASGAVLKVRVGDEETTIPFSKEPDHEDATKSSRFGSAQAVPQASASAAAEVAEELDAAGGGGAQPLLDGPLGALGADAGDRCDRAGEGLPADVLPAGDPSAKGDASSHEPALEQHGGSGSAALGGELANRATAGEDQASRAGEAPQRAAAAFDAQVSSCAR
ncbi:MAG TPA: DDE-type integrase/transposase/recombinase [Steroidobacteraceae bacterium]|nr:DDE-type integrase/transposase/recombinase [Steroidobacteraceae bacterium]